MATKRTSLVKEYHEHFLEHLACVSPLIESQCVQLFMGCLGAPLGIDVELKNPQSPEVATVADPGFYIRVCHLKISYTIR